MVTTQIINDPASMERQGLLLAAFEATAAEWTAKADRLHQIGDTARLETALTIAYGARETAARIRLRMAAAVEADQPPGLADLLAKLPDEKLAQIAPSATALVPVEAYEPGHLTPATPGTLVELVRWIRQRWESVLPGLSNETWQTIACAVLLRRQGGGS